MKNLNLKSTMIVAIFVICIISVPITALGKDDQNTNNSDSESTLDSYSGGFGGIFSENMGYGGQIIGDLFEMLLLEGVDLENKETTEGVYTLSASKEEIYEGTYDFEEEDDTEEIHFLPYIDEWNWTGIPSQPIVRPIDNINDYYWNESIYGYAYCVVKKSGSFNYTLTVGAALTLIIWDNDGSFIEAAQKILDWAEEFREAEKKDEVDSEIVAEGAEVITWLLVHINEIFTGDELFVFNPIVWQKLIINPESEFNITKTWFYTGLDNDIDEDDKLIEGQILKNETFDPFSGEKPSWKYVATSYRDYYMQWLLEPSIDPADLAQTVWTQFSFDLIQLWMKEFYLEIDMKEISNGDDSEFEKAFERCDIEFYLFTHHLAGVFLYDDNNSDTIPTVEYVPVQDKYTGNYTIINGTVAMIPQSSEVTHQIFLSSVENFAFSEPEITDDDTVRWGLTLSNAKISPVPVGVDINTILNATEEELRYIYFGLEFEKDLEKPDKNGEIEGSALVKLEHNFAPWNNDTKPYTKTDIAGLDMCILYVSSILHFDLEMEKDDDPDEPDNEEYQKVAHTLQVGDYISDDSEDKLDFVDIAGVGYWLGNDTDLNNLPDSGSSLYPANTTNINIGSFEGIYEERKEYEGEDEDTAEEDFSSDLSVAVTWDFMFYAVCYPEFNGTGMGIWHDPMYSIYIVFSPEEEGFWAVILLIAGVCLAGVACIIIKRWKDRRI